MKKAWAGAKMVDAAPSLTVVDGGSGYSRLESYAGAPPVRLLKTCRLDGPPLDVVLADEKLWVSWAEDLEQAANKEVLLFFEALQYEL